MFLDVSFVSCVDSSSPYSLLNSSSETEGGRAVRKSLGSDFDLVYLFFKVIRCIMDCGLGYFFRARTAKISCYPNQRSASEQETLQIKVTITPSN